MSTQSLAPLLSIAGPRAGLLRPSLSLSICHNCLRSFLPSVNRQHVRGKKTLPKAAGIKVRLLKDIPGYGPKGSIMMVARGRMRTIWYQRGEAEYLTRDLAKQLGKYTLVERDPGFQPVVVQRATGPAQVGGGPVKDTLLTSAETVITLSSVLPPFIRFFRATTAPYANTLHGSVTASDVANAIKMIAQSSKHPHGSRVVVTGDNVTFVKQPERDRVKTIGEYEVEITFKGEEAIKRSVVVMREEEDSAAGVVSSAAVGLGGGSSIFKTPQRREL
ncbi:hypothetical protein TWF696_003907 [Orbilia brochopaga]|uniref:Ribosomal protein L9 domain-containing protein n=1 Tax=Orbilia brochopaga TaxID=3140254 RepID=A0AAV9V4M4_9PEZI